MIAVGQTIGNYNITAKLGEGGMGVVYLAEHPVIGRKVALKAIHPELSRNPEVVSRFVTEAKSVNQIGNEHIVDIHDFGNTSDGEFYFIMEFLQGEALSDRLKHSAPLDSGRALAIAAQVADALGASHQHGIVHRDLKPENIYLITKGHIPDFVKVLDFGLAKLTMGDDKVTHKTRTGSVMGTPYYMAPEQCEGKANIDHRADIYSLGVILFEMLTGKVPFGGEGYGEIIVKHITSPVPSPRAINPLLSPSLENITLRALAKSRDQRFQTMQEFATALLDPERYAASAPHLNATVLSVPATQLMDIAGGDSSERSGNVVNGQPGLRNPGGTLAGNYSHDAGALPSPMPSTFRHATGEIANDGALDVVAKPRRTGLFAAIAGAAVIAGLAAYYYTQKPQPNSPSQPIAATVPSTTPTPRTVKLNFKSDPSGAAVLRQDTNEQIGITPFDREVPIGQTAIVFLFKKDNFRDKAESYVPTEPGQLEVALLPNPPPPTQEPPVPRAEPKPVSKSAPVRTSADGHHKSGAGRGHRGRSMDEDGVLAPSF